MKQEKQASKGDRVEGRARLRAGASERALVSKNSHTYLLVLLKDEQERDA